MFDMHSLEFKEKEQCKYLYNQQDNSCYELRYGISQLPVFENYTVNVRWIGLNPVLSFSIKSNLNSNSNKHSILALSQTILRDSDLTIWEEFTEVNADFVGPILTFKRV